MTVWIRNRFKNGIRFDSIEIKEICIGTIPS